MKIGWRRVLITVSAAFLMAALAVPVPACTGDCNGDGQITVDELMIGVNIALDSSPLSSCPFFDQSNDNAVTVDEVLDGIDAAVGGCPPPVISSIAGTGTAGFNGDGLDPLDTQFYLPQDVTVGPDGLVYIVDWNNHRVRRINGGKLETVAGTGTIGDAKDGVALYANFNHPTNVIFDAQGRMIIAAWHNSTVKRLDLTTGLLENVAGTGARSFSGDGGPANAAALNLPSSTVVDTLGNLYISDQANFRIRIVNGDGIIDTMCGSTAGYSGDGGPAKQAKLNAPKGQAAAPAGRITIDAQNRIYIADTGNHAVRMIDTDGKISTLAGTGEPGYSGDGGPAKQAQLNSPSDVALASNGIIYIADTQNSAVRMIRPDGTISTLAGTGNPGFSGDGGRADQADLNQPYGLTVAANGDVLIADSQNQRVREVAAVPRAAIPTPHPTPTPEIIPCTEVPGSICTYVGDGETAFNGDGRNRLLTALYWPFDIEFTKSGRRILLDWNNHKVREILPDDTLTTIMGTDFVGDGPENLSDLTPEGADPLTVNLNHPTDIQEFSNGDIMLMAWHNHKIRVINHEDSTVRVILGAGPGGFPMPGDGVPAKTALVNQPPHGVLDSKGNLFFIDQRNQRIRVVYDFDSQRENAIVDTVVGTWFCSKTTTMTCLVDSECPSGETCNVKPGFNGDQIARQTQLNLPTGGNPEPSGGLALDGAGNLYFSDTNNNRIRKVQFFDAQFKQGIVTTIAGTGEAAYGGDGGPAQSAQINYPEDMEIGPDGNLYFADTNNNRVRMINLTTGTIETVAGTGENGYSGDGGSALAARFNRPFGVAFDQQGDLYISDTFNSRVRRVKR